MPAITPNPRLQNMSPEGLSYPRPPIVLIVTPQEWLRLSIESIFSPRGYAAVRATGASQARRRVRDTPADLIVIDVDLRDRPGIALCALLRAEHLITETTPVLMVAPHAWAREEKLMALRAGAWDACSLPMHAEELFLRADAWVRAKLAADADRERGLLDASTGLYNAQGLLRRLGEVAAAAARYQRPFACLIVSPAEPSRASPGSEWTSLTAGRVAAALRDTGRASDCIGLLNASEFVIVAPETDVNGARGLAERLSAVLHALPGVGAREPRIGCYAVSEAQSEPVASTEMLVRAAQALRRAERRGQTIGFFQPELC